MNVLLKRLRVHHAFYFSCFFLIPLIFIDLKVLLDWKYWSLFFTVFVTNIIVYFINDYFDRFEDVHDSKKKVRNIFCSKKLFKRAKTFLLLSILFTLILAIISPFHFLTVFGLYTFILLYSHTLTKFKGKPVIDIVIHITWFFLIFIVGWTYSAIVNTWFFLILLFILINSTGIQLGQQTRDFEIDEKTGLKTTAHILGKKNSHKISRALDTFSFIFFFFIIITNIALRILF